MKAYHYSQVKRAYDAAVLNGQQYVNVKFSGSKAVNLPLHVVELILRGLSQ